MEMASTSSLLLIQLSITNQDISAALSHPRQRFFAFPPHLEVCIPQAIPLLKYFIRF